MYSAGELELTALAVSRSAWFGAQAIYILDAKKLTLIRKVDLGRLTTIVLSSIAGTRLHPNA